MARRPTGVPRERDAFTGSNQTTAGVPAWNDRSSTQGFRPLNGIFTGKVVDAADENYQGHVWVDLSGSEIVDPKDTIERRHNFHKVRQLSPFGGVVQGDTLSNNYGASWAPPQPGTEVVVGFNGRDQEGYLLGVLADINRNSMMPGFPSSPKLNSSGEEEIVTAFDWHVYQEQPGNQREVHPLQEAIARQGLLWDPIRGIGSSGARRESPSQVSGFNTPAGHSIVLDDGTIEHRDGENFVPDKSRESGKNNLVRLRSGFGAQVLLNDSAGIVYINNQEGSSWIQMDKDGNVDVFAAGNVSYHAEQSINFYAQEEFNIDADSINVRARGAEGIKVESTVGEINMSAQDDIKITTKRNMHLRAGPHMRLTAKLIDLNGPPAVSATKPTVAALAVNRSVKESVNNRVPEHEPWLGHLEQETVLHAQAKSRIEDTDENDYSVSNSSGARGAGAGSRTTSASGSSTNPSSAPSGQTGEFTDADISSVEELREFNDSIGGGAARAELTPSERAYARSQGYTSDRSVPPRTETSSTSTSRYASASSDINPRTGRAWTDVTIRGL